MRLPRVLPCVLLVAASASQAALTHDYELNGSLADGVGSLALTDHGGTLGATGYTFGKNQGLTLGADLGAVYTIDIGYRFDTHSGWQKIVDFSDLAVDTGMYTFSNEYDFYNTGGFGNVLADGEDVRLTLSRDVSGLVSVYGNGSLLGTFTDSGNLANFTGHNANFFIDDFATGQREAGTGFVDYIRVYDTALLPPVPEPAAYALMLAGLGVVGAVARRRR